jgi:hypothetical protein
MDIIGRIISRFAHHVHPLDYFIVQVTKYSLRLVDPIVMPGKTLHHRPQIATATQEPQEDLVISVEDALLGSGAQGITTQADRTSALPTPHHQEIPVLSISVSVCLDICQ